jgi:cell wall-associated NlpC family hydrolase
VSRRIKGTLLCAIALLALPLCGGALAAPAGGGPGAPSTGDTAYIDSGASLGALSRTVLAAIATTAGADEALAQLGSGMALMEARNRIESEAKQAAQAYAESAPDPAEIVPGDPSTMPPASAGSNGTTIPGHSAAMRQKIFANSRAAHDGSTSILLTGIALPPPDAPQAVQDVINNANMIVGRPYIWGGGHGSFYSYGYDCSGAVSFALFGGGMIPRPLASGELEGWGAPGPGKWITVYANHTYAEIAGLRYDTSGTESGTGPRWHLEERPSDGFVVRHPPGY